MADERDDDQFGGSESNGQKTAGQQGQGSEYGSQGQQAGGMGSQQTMNEERSGDQDGSQRGDATDSEPRTDAPLDQGSDVQGRSSTGQIQQSGGEGFIGSQGSGSDDYLQDRRGSSPSGNSASSANATGGSDFAERGRGALDEEDEKSGSSGGMSGGSDKSDNSGGGSL